MKTEKSCRCSPTVLDGENMDAQCCVASIRLADVARWMIFRVTACNGLGMLLFNRFKKPLVEVTPSLLAALPGSPAG